MSLLQLARCLMALIMLASVASAQDRLPLRVLYAGDGDTKRADEFVAFFTERTAGGRSSPHCSG